MPYQRRLAAIMFTDIQGYTRLMQESEAQAVSVRARHREIFDPSTIKFRGEIIQYYGDGTLSIFSSCVDAVQCAYEMQRAFQQAPAIPVRIGIHLGDILQDPDDIIGDSVNLASRVESLGIPGSVLISNKVYEEIKNKPGLSVKSMGEFHFKNDARPRSIYALDLPGLVVPETHQLQGKLERPSKKSALANRWSALIGLLIIILLAVASWFTLLSSTPKLERLAVLPLQNRIGDVSQEYLVDGMHEELISKLLSSGIKVRPYTTMKNYKDSDKSAKAIATELEVDALVEGSISRIGDEIRIKLQLISGKQEEYLMEPIESQVPFSDIMLLYGNVVRSLASKIEATFDSETHKQLDNLRSVNPVAYDWYLKGRYQLNLGTTASIQEAIQFFNKSLEADESFGQAHKGLVESYLLLGFSSLNSREAYAQFRIHLQKALELNEEFAKDHHQLAMIKIFTEWDWEGAAEELRLAIEEKPDSWEAQDSYCQLMWAMGRMDESVAAGEKAVALDPKAHFARCDLAWAYFFDGDYTSTKSQLRRLFDEQGADCPYHSALNYYVQLYDSTNHVNYDKIISELEDRAQRFPDDEAHISSLLGYTYVLKGNREKALEIVEELHQQGNLNTAKIYLALGDKDMAINILERTYEQRSFLLMYVIKEAPWLDGLRDDPRFIDLLERMGLANEPVPTQNI